MSADKRDENQRVAVTGMGVVVPNGETVAQFWDSLKSGRSGITRWRHRDERIYSKIGGDLSDFDLKAHLGRVGAGYPPDLVDRALRLLRVTPLPGRVTASAALQAFLDAGLPHPSLIPERFAHLLGGHNLASAYQFDNALAFQEEPEYIDPLYSLLYLDTDVLSVISELLQLKGPSLTIGGACASGNLALLTALDMLRSGRADAALVTGGSVSLEPLGLQALAIVDALSIRTFNDRPEQASRPWDARREGFVPSEGAGAVVIEPLARARARGARIHAELLGGAAASDASRLPKPCVEGQMRAMRLALQDAGVAPQDVDYINAHATATILGDVVEVEAIKAVFGAHAYRIPVNATKSMIGHCLTSASMVQFVATILQMENCCLHPTINLDEPEPGLDLDFVPHQARSCCIDVALSNAFGFGGLNTAVVTRRAP